MRTVKNHSFNGIRYKIEDQTKLDVGDLGECDYDKKTIRIPVEGDTLDELDCIIHESIHACIPTLAEDPVETSATSIAKLLWKLGWRKLDETVDNS